MGSRWKICTRACWTRNAPPPRSLGAGRRGLKRCALELINCCCFFIHFFLNRCDGQTTWDIASARRSLSLFLLPTHLSLSLCVQMSQTRHRAMAAPEITLAPGNVQELSRILQGRKRHIIRFWWSFDFFLSNNKRESFSLSESRLYTTRVKNTHHLRTTKTNL